MDTNTMTQAVLWVGAAVILIMFMARRRKRRALR
ncbi:MAG: LPXTG cell wall anchor domain-containing protein [Acidobacteria bacterium]|nr:LPXTG cell wall anchor domain-containing protein [Acidobacteriota bacterium]